MMIKEEKDQLRRWVRGELIKLTAEEKSAASARISDKVVEEISLMEPQPITVASFFGLSIEPDLSSLHGLLPHVRLVYPLCRKDRVLEFYHIEEPARQLKKGYYGLYEPDPELCELAEIESIDLFLVPSFAYTKDGHRLGKGGGYYDRALSKARPDAKTLGVAFQCQLVESLPTQAHDVLIDRVIAL